MTIDWEGLVVGFESRSSLITHFLDRESGDVVQVVEARDPSRHAELSASPRHLALPKDRGERGVGEMQLFLGEVEDEKVREALKTALSAPDPADAYRTLLMEYPREEAKYFQFKERRARERAEEWLASMGVPFEKKPPIVRGAREYPGVPPRGR